MVEWAEVSGGLSFQAIGLLLLTLLEVSRRFLVLCVIDLGDLAQVRADFLPLDDCDAV